MCQCFDANGSKTITKKDQSDDAFHEQPAREKVELMTRFIEVL